MGDQLHRSRVVPYNTVKALQVGTGSGFSQRPRLSEPRRLHQTHQGSRRYFRLAYQPKTSRPATAGGACRPAFSSMGVNIDAAPS